MFKPGEPIIAIRDHSEGKFLKGTIFDVKSVAPSACTCYEFLVDVGFTGNDIGTYCDVCKTYFVKPSSALWFANDNFVSLDSDKGGELFQERIDEYLKLKK